MVKMHHEAHGEGIRGHYFIVVLVKYVLAHGLETVLLKVGTLCFTFIRIRVSLLSLFSSASDYQWMSV